MIETKHTFCPLDCPDSCALIATVEDGIVTKLEGDSQHEFTRGFICRKMRKYHERVESSERILYPMKRAGKKGQGDFDRISWDEAWQIMVDQLHRIKKEHGGEALLPYSYAGNMGVVARVAGYPFFNKFGASRLDHTICSSAAKAGWKAHLGSRPGTDPLEATNSSLVVAWGINVKITNIHFWPMIQKSRRNGGKLVVIDPYRNLTAKAADYYYPVKPAGDVALALGAVKVIIELKKENRDFIERKTSGFERLKSYVNSLSWKNIESDSGLTKDKISEFASLLIENPKTFLRIGNGLSRNTQGAMTVRAIVSLAMTLGILDNLPGRGVLLSTSAFSGDNDKVAYRSLAEKKTRLVNMVQLAHALTTMEPKVYGLFVYNSNPLSVAPDSSQIKEGLLRDDLFTIVHEQVMTPTAKYADLILPATTMLENKDIYTAYGHFFLGIAEPAIKPRGEAIDNFSLFQELSRKMGYSDPAFHQSIDDRIIDYLDSLKGVPDQFDPKLLKPGMYIKSTYSDFKNHPENGQTFKFYCDQLPETQPAIPIISNKTEMDDPDLLSRYSLRLITPPDGNLLNSTFGDLYPEETGNLLIHPADAEIRQIEDGRSVTIFNHRGSIERTAKVTNDTQPGLVVAEGLYWSESKNGINELTSQKTTDLGGGGTFHENICEVVPN